MSGRVYYAHIAEDTNGRPVRIQTCTEHARRTASLAAEILVDQGLFYSGYSAGLLHDCGKFTDEFSAYLSKAARVKK